MGTRMVSAAESPVHQNWKDAIINAKETDTLFLNRHGPGPALRALKTERTTKLDHEPTDNIMGEMRGVLDLYFGGDMEAAIALSGQVAGRIDDVKSAKLIIDEVISEFHAIMEQMAKTYL
jgi:enoyl-[acyl-carrier protein] reductase II